MVWGAFTWNGMVNLAFPSTKMNSAEYIQTLNNNLLPYLRKYRSVKYVFQQDNASIHSSHETKSWMKSKKIKVMDWPACSPDQNPIENIWGILARRVYADNKQYRDIPELKCAILESWSTLEEKIRKRLVDSMPNRIFELIQRNGGPTHY